VDNVQEFLLEPFSECVLTSGPFTNRLIEVEDGVDQAVTFVYNSCATTPAELDISATVVYNMDPMSTCPDMATVCSGVETDVSFTLGADADGLFVTRIRSALESDPDDGSICGPGAVDGYNALVTGGTLAIGDDVTAGITQTFVNSAGELARVSFQVEPRNSATGCTGEPRWVDIVIQPATEVTFDDLGSFCELVEETLIVTGGATPAGGVYGGTGVTDNADGTFTIDFAALALGDNEITYTVVGAGDCEYSAVATLTVEECVIEVTDPCSCNDDASPIIFDAEAGTYDNPNDGTFGEVVSVSSPAGLPNGLDLRVTAVTGALDVTVGDALIFDAGAYEIAFNHPDDVGYTITIDQFVNDRALGLDLTISNICAYPNPVFDPTLDPIYCNFEEPITLGGTDDDDVNASPTPASFTVNGSSTATVFDPTDT
jgi:hypothetical protein